MLGSRKSGRAGSGAITLVSRDTRIAGDIHFSGTLDVEGKVTGNIHAVAGTDALVRVVDKGCVEGEIRAPSVIVNGQIQGNVYAEKHLELAPRARVLGDVYYAQVEMSVGAEVNGRMMHVDSAEAAQQARRSTGRSTKMKPATRTASPGEHAGGDGRESAATRGPAGAPPAGASLTKASLTKVD